MGQHQTKNILHSKGIYWQNEKVTYWMGKDINACKWYIQQVTNIQNTQRTHITQYQKNDLTKKWAEDMNRYFSKEDMQMANRYKKRCSKSLISREMQIKTTLTYHLALVRMTIIKKTANKKEVFASMWRKWNPHALFIGM